MERMSWRNKNQAGSDWDYVETEAPGTTKALSTSRALEKAEYSWQNRKTALKKVKHGPNENGLNPSPVPNLLGAQHSD